tara:strand:- start:243 stop:587 length:345 start_codon:yes stop_codon:yes gene_type:complete
MKNVLILICIFTLAGFAQSQTTYEIKIIGSDYTAEQINNAFAGADMCKFYYVSERRELIFDDGAIIELKKQSELPQLENDCFITKKPAHADNIWEITDAGYLIRRIQTLPNKNN